VRSNYTAPAANFTDNPGWRNFMSRELFAHLCVRAGLLVEAQKLLDWEEPNLDCLTLKTGTPSKPPIAKRIRRRLIKGHLMQTKSRAVMRNAPSSTKNAGNARNPEMRTKQGNHWYFDGLCAHPLCAKSEHKILDIGREDNAHGASSSRKRIQRGRF